MYSSFENPRLRLFAGALMISFSPVFVKLTDVAPTTSGFYRVLFGGVVVAIYLLLTRQRLTFKAAAWTALALSAVFFALDLWFWHRSILYIGPGLSTLLANFQVFIMMAAGIVLFGQKPGPRQIAAVPLAIAGLALVVGFDWQELPRDYQLGIVFGLLTAVCYAGYLLCMRQARMVSAHTVPTREIAVMSLLVAAMLGAAAFAEGVSLEIPTVSDLVWLLLYGVLANALGMLFIASSLSKVTTTEVGLALLLQPTCSFIWDILFFGRSFSVTEGTGAVLALAAIYLGSVRKSHQA
ncbi:MAG: DMT family transporter [Gammaproteobacteria bacterium]|nr:DMT family transporter [Gammaproteobacteria bacterium]MDH4313747.1 DMT family transporter [Gammaproteobacteria bacterium]MDH5213467.1 DMT family transporter [Gammaproteobacteria bacterium]MDH5500251.1 DMT family transporter [Gammaproteobacteria bacterium]